MEPDRPGGPARPWVVAFGRGCRVVKKGVWVDAVGMYWLFVVLTLAWWARLAEAGGAVRLKSVGLYAFLPVYLFQLIGTTMVFLGRMRMRDVRPNSGATGLLTGAAASCVCHVAGSLHQASHLVLIGRVLDVVTPEGTPPAPLMYHMRRFTTVSQALSAERHSAKEQS